MTTYRDYLISREYRREMLHTAEKHRLIRSISLPKHSVAPHLRMLTWTGRQLEALGRRLQQLSYPNHEETVYNGSTYVPVPRTR